MSVALGLARLHPASSDNKPHYVGYSTARTTADDALFEVWNGSTKAARVLRVNKDGQVQLQNGAVGAPALAPEGDKDTGIYFVTSTPEVAVAVAGSKVVSVVAAGMAVTGTFSVSSTSEFTGAVTFEAGGRVASGANFEFGSSQNYIKWTGSMLRAVVASNAILDHDGDQMDVFTAGARRIRIDNAGRVLIGAAAVSTGAGAREIVLENNRWIRANLADDSDTRPIIKFNSNNRPELGGTAGLVIIPTPGTMTGAGAANNGGIAIDTANNRLVYYSGGNRYHLTGTAF